MLLAPDREPQAALRDGRLLVPRLLPQARSGLLETPTGDYRLGLHARGSLDGLRRTAVDATLSLAGS